MHQERGNSKIVIGATRASCVSSERIEDADPFDFATVAQILGIELTAAERPGSGDDGAVPVRKPWDALICKAPVTIESVISWTLKRVQAETKPTALS